MRLVRSGGKLHDLRLTIDVCFISVVLGPAKAIIVLTNLLLNFLLNRIELSGVGVLFVLRIRLVWLGLHSRTRGHVLAPIIRGQLRYVGLGLLSGTLAGVVLGDAPVRFGLGIGAALVERLRDGGRQIILLLLLHNLLVSIRLLA